MDATKYARSRKAATLIQAWYRGWKARRDYQRLKAALVKIQAHARGWCTRRKVQKMKHRLQLERRFDAAMERHRQRIYLLELDKREILAVPASELDDWQARRHKAATLVQARWRGLVERRKFGQRSPERLRREQAAVKVQKAFKQMIGRMRASQQQQDSPLGSPVASPFPDSRLGGMRPDQSGSVLMGSPPQMNETMAAYQASQRAAAAEADAEAAMRGSVRASMQQRQAGPASYMSSKRYQDLMRQVEDRVEMYKAQAKHQRQDPRVVDARLAALLRAYSAAAEPNIRAAHARQAALVASEALAAQLDAAPALAGLPPGAQPHEFPRPARGSERAARAGQAHALALADARAGSRWWTHLRALNHGDVQHALLEEDADRWHSLDQLWRRQWRAIEAEEQGRAEPDTGLHRGPVPPLSDLAISDEEDQRQRQRRWGQRQEEVMSGAMEALAQRLQQEAEEQRRVGRDAGRQSFGLVREVDGAGLGSTPIRPGSEPVIIIPTAAPGLVFHKPTQEQHQQQQQQHHHHHHHHLQQQGAMPRAFEGVAAPGGTPAAASAAAPEPVQDLAAEHVASVPGSGARSMASSHRGSVAGGSVHDTLEGRGSGAAALARQSSTSSRASQGSGGGERAGEAGGASHESQRGPTRPPAAPSAQRGVDASQAAGPGQQQPSLTKAGSDSGGGVGAAAGATTSVLPRGSMSKHASGGGNASAAPSRPGSGPASRAASVAGGD